MSTAAFALLFLPACMAVPAGLAVGVVAEALIERIGRALARPGVVEAGRRAVAAGRAVRLAAEPAPWMPGRPGR
ncbi:hypothetical protein [Paludisphaera sp.]|uniref:hypothetical protein n=1 Tax=Paludisphaera sp. TaxID=2017432 RepID=UPI00301D0A50